MAWRFLELSAITLCSRTRFMIKKNLHWDESRTCCLNTDMSFSSWSQITWLKESGSLHLIRCNRASQPVNSHISRSNIRTSNCLQWSFLFVFSHVSLCFCLSCFYSIFVVFNNCFCTYWISFNVSLFSSITNKSWKASVLILFKEL